MGLHFLAFWPCGPSFPCILALWAFISLHFGSILQFLAFWAFISLHFGLVGIHFLVFWPCGPSFPFILAFSGSASRVSPPQVAKNGPFAQRPYNGFISAVTGSILKFLAFWAFISVHFGLVGLHFLVFWPCGPSFISLHFGLVGLHFLSFWPCGPSFPCILALWAFISLHFGLACRHCGPSFPCILALWAFTSLHFGLVGLHFLAFWPCGLSFPCMLAFSGSASGPPPQVARNGPFAQRPYNGFISAVTGSILQFLTFWAFISLYFGPVGLHFLSFWLFRGQLLGSPPQVAKNGPFAQRPYNGFISAVTGSILKFLAFWAFISVHFGLVGLHFLVFWPCGPSFPCILALWAFISLHFGLVGLHFLAFWPCRPSFPFILALWAFISLRFGLVGFHFLAFWPCRPCGPSFPCILALWAFISLHFGLVGLHFLAFWPCGLSFPCILAFSGSASGVPPQVARNGPFAQRPYNGFISAVTGSILQFLTFWAFFSLHFGLVGLHFLAFWLCRPSFPCILALWAFILASRPPFWPLGRPFCHFGP